VLAVVIAAALLLHKPAEPKVPRVGLGAFAGYVWESGSVSSISASWVVPRLTRHSSLGRAGTWIGAQAPGGNNAAFIQIGTNEERHAAVGNMYYAFWADTADGFHPQWLWPVGRGDRIEARMTLANGRWHLMIKDARGDDESNFTTAQEANGAFNQAEWLQEDITKYGTTLFPYPSLSRVHFAHLTVNGAPPEAAALYSQWMSAARHPYLAPTAVDDDAFSLGAATLSPAAAKYLSIVDPMDNADYNFYDELDAWSAEKSSVPSQFTVRLASATIRVTLRDGFHRLAAYDWSPPVRRLIDRLLLTWREQLAAARPPTTLGRATLRHWRQIVNAAPSPEPLGDAIRLALGAPEFS
jgi:hypothetical protein